MTFELEAEFILRSITGYSPWKGSFEKGPGRVKMHGMLGTVSQTEDASPVLKAASHKKVQWSSMLGKYCIQ